MSCSRCLICAILSLLPAIAQAAPPATAPVAQRPIRVLIWDEQQPEQKEAYGDKFLGQTLAAALSKNPNLRVTSAGMPPAGMVDRDPSLSFASLNDTDVLIWWGHKRQREVKGLIADRIVERVKANKLALVALHSAHWSGPFISAMNARAVDDAMKALTDPERKIAKTSLIYPKLAVPKADAPLTPSVIKGAPANGVLTLVINLPLCVFPSYRADGKPSHVTTLMPEHPIAKGLPATWDIAQTEMYNEPFHVPTPDAVIFEEKWDAGEHFRTGALWNVGSGKVFYFRPGHETYPVYKQDLPVKVVENAALWLGEQVQKASTASTRPAKN